jgi:hypothetical protein
MKVMERISKQTMNTEISLYRDIGAQKASSLIYRFLYQYAVFLLFTPNSSLRNVCQFSALCLQLMIPHSLPPTIPSISPPFFHSGEFLSLGQSLAF